MGKFSFGIDLGTTNSCISVMQGTDAHSRRPQVITLEDNRNTLPSCVWFKRDGSIVVGREAYKHRYLTDEVVYSSKRFIGTNHVYSLHDGKLKVTPVQVAAEILKKLKHDAEILYGEGAVDEAVITVPAYFDSNKRKATKQAAEMAGISIRSIINEPTSAALAYTLGNMGNDQFLVYDLGGGTFDVTLMNVSNSSSAEFEMFQEMETSSTTLAQVLASAGDDHLGGDDLDRMIYELALDRVNKEANSHERIHDFDIRDHIDEDMQEKIILFIEDFKKSSMLSSSTACHEIKVKLGRSEKTFVVKIDENLIREALEPIYYRTLKKVQECLESKPGSTFNKIVLIGGSTKLKLLQERLREDFPDTPIYAELNPDEAVALGAAVQMDINKGDTELIVSDVLPRSVGIDCILMMDDMQIPGRFKPVISKDTVLPAEGSITLTTIEDNQKILPVAIYQGESFLSDENTYLGTIILEDANTSKRGEDDVILRMRIDGNGILTTSLTVGKQTTQIQLQNILNPIEETVKESKNKIQEFIDKVENSDLNEQVKADFVSRLLECNKDMSKLVQIKKELRQAMSKSAKKSDYFNTASNYTASIDFDGADGDI